jgi:hypothetical protein
METTAQQGVRTMDSAFHELLAVDTNAANITDALRRDAPMGPGPTLIPVARYTSREYHELEKELLWSRTWQMAAHEDDFPNVTNTKRITTRVCIGVASSGKLGAKDSVKYAARFMAGRGTSTAA